jgi:hypothetical protein
MSNTSSVNKNDIFWEKDPSILFSKSDFYKIIPSTNQTRNENLNNLTRFFIYLFIISFLLSLKEICYISIICIIVIYFIGKIQPKEGFNLTHQTIEKEKKKSLKKIIDQVPHTTKEKLENQKINDNLQNFLNGRYDERPFYGLSHHKIMNDQSKFAKWLYQGPPTCKEDPMSCKTYEDLRFHRTNPEISSLDFLE